RIVKAGDELGGQPRRAADVLQRDDLDGCVHVADGDADDRGGHAVPADLDGPGLRAGTARHWLRVQVDLQRLRLLADQVEQARVRVRADDKRRTPAELEALVLADAVALRIRHVEHDGDIRLGAP